MKIEPLLFIFEPKNLGELKIIKNYGTRVEDILIVPDFKATDRGLMKTLSDRDLSMILKKIILNIKED